MRVALVVSGLPPYARSDVEVHGAALAEALAAEGLEVEVCAPRVLPGLAPLAQRREERGDWAVTWINLDSADPPEEAERADAFASFLDRERPQVVHFEDLARFGLGAVLEVEGRGLPAVYSAHDWFALSDQLLLLAPDGSSVTPDDREQEARMVLALAWLRGEGHIEPAAEMACPDDLDGATRARLAALLGGVEDDEHLERARAEVRARVERRKAAFSSFGARFAATRHLARRLSATLGRAVDWRAPGIDLAPFERARASRGAGRPLRFGYVGPLGRPHGVQVLLEAFAGLAPGAATLVLHGDTEERAHLQRLRARARELDVEWGGPCRAEDTPALLAGLDVRVVPSLWSGGACFAAIEAAAAGRPVIAPRSEALADSVRDDVDGLLFECGDADSLRGALERFLAEEFLHDRFELELRAPRTIRSEAREWIDTYQELRKTWTARRPQPNLPAHVEPFAARHADLAGLSTRALLGRVLAGLEVLGGQMGLNTEPRDFLLLAAGRGSRLRDTAAADRRVIGRLQRSIERIQSARAELEERAGWHEQQLAELRARLREQERSLATREAEVTEARRARDELAAQKAADQDERARLEAALAQRLEAARSLEVDLAATRETHARLEEERVLLERTLDDSARELRYLRERVAGEDGDDSLGDHEAIEQHFDSLEQELAGLREHEIWLRRAVGELLGEPERADLVDSLEAGRAGLERLVKELSWRREEMAAARAASQRLFVRLAGGELASRVRRWDREEPS